MREVRSVAYSSDGSMLASGGGYEDGQIRLWDSRTGRLWFLSGRHTGKITSVAFSPGGFTLASASDDKTIRMRNARTGTELYSLEGHTDGVTSVAFSPDGFTLASGNNDGTILLWGARLGTTWGDIKQMGIVDGTRRSPELSPSAKPVAPSETALLPNYPNPFNPETWIPFHLADDADATLTIYDAAGVLVRQFDLGYQSAGFYTDRGRASYWDGRNQQGETVANGVYFCTLTAGDFTATRKMLVGK